MSTTPISGTTPTPAPAAEMVTVTIDGQTQQFPKGTVLLEACNQMGAGVPFFCYHPGLSSPAVCRQCLVDVKGQPKPVPSCYTPVADKMEVMTKSPRALDVRRQMLEFTLVNHPIDCPICDKAGECMLQKHYFDWDAKLARNDGIKVKKAKVVDVGPRIVLDQERCILCTRCIRVCDEVAKNHQLEMADRGDHEILTTAPGHQLDNPYSLNTVDVCPVGALTSKDFRFAMRAWELYTTPSICPGCATGCNLEVHHSRGKIQRLIPRQNDQVNKHWMCDEGRLTYKRVHPTVGNLEGVPEPSRDGLRAAEPHYAHAPRLAAPMSGGSPVEWDKALDDAGRVLRAALDAGSSSVGVVMSAQSTNEDLYALARLTFDHLGLAEAYLSGLDQGWSDDILVSADKNPNTAGAMAIGAGRLRTLLDLANDLKSGAVTTLLVVGTHGVLGKDGAGALPLDRLQTLVVIGTHRDAVAAAAKVALPLTEWAESDGTFTNRLGMVQRVRAAVPAAGDSLPGWEILSHLARKLGATMEFTEAKAVFAEAKQKLAFMKDADWGRPLLPVQLRFAGSRG
ncbi:MAG TPA: 2Fe-2S iron-sulfur cluster-binding protein [Polyangia bacterium]|nr:2Fe-2S iron-sulfur cluster-binding protein [Polyangia bacterium]